MSSILYCCQMTNSYLIQKVALCCHLRNKHGYFAFVNADGWHTNEIVKSCLIFLMLHKLSHIQDTVCILYTANVCRCCLAYSQSYKKLLA